MPKVLPSDLTLQWPEGKGPNWKQTPNGMDGGKFGSIQWGVYGSTDDTGVFQPTFDRPVVVEGPHAITIAFGRDPKDGEFKIGLVKEQRDTAAPADGKTSLYFWGPPRGFAEDTDNGPIDMAKRETGEETGAKVLAGEPWLLGKYITNETCTASWSPIVAVPVDLGRISSIQNSDQSPGEKIVRSQFFTLNEIESMIAERVYDKAHTTSMVLGQIVLLYRIHLRGFESCSPEGLKRSYQLAWYPSLV